MEDYLRNRDDGVQEDKLGDQRYEIFVYICVHFLGMNSKYLNKFKSLLMLLIGSQELF